MLHKSSRPGYKRIIKSTAKYLLIAEGIAFAATYVGWSQLNTNRDLRHYVKENYPTILESYYQVGEFFSADKTIRKHDEQIWEQHRQAASER